MATSNNIKLDITKTFPVAVSRLYEAWINPEDLKKWWHPMGNTLQKATTKPEVGAPVEYVFTTEGGEHSFTIKGTYKEVQEEKRLVYTWKWQLPAAAVADSDYQLTVTFNTEGNDSRLSVTQENFSNEEAVQPHHAGWEDALNSLHYYLSQQS